MSLQDKLLQSARQQQFLSVVTPEEATARFHHHLRLEPLGTEYVSLDQALHRVLASAVVAPIDVPNFDRASVDGFAVRSEDTNSYGTPAVLSLNPEVLTPGVIPTIPVLPGTATPIATGSMLPRGADAVVMIEHTDLLEEEGRAVRLAVYKMALPGQFIAFAGTDISKGETLLREKQVFTARELGIVAALGLAEVEVYRRPRVAIFSTGDEVIAPGEAVKPGKVFDSNAVILSASVKELGGEPVSLGIVPDDETLVEKTLHRALAECDIVLFSGGTSKGAGDISYRSLRHLSDPGILVHGVAIKPGKPLCLAVTKQKPVVILPGFPTSAIFTFHTFVAPIIRCYSGQPTVEDEMIQATLPVRVYSELGRTEFLLVCLLPTENGLAAYPLGKGSGSVTSFSFADGFIAIEAQTEWVPAGTSVLVQSLSKAITPADLIFIGSQCVGLDRLLTLVQQQGYNVKSLYVGSQEGAAAVRRGECDVAGVHLLDPGTGKYNIHLTTPEISLVPGYRRMQSFVFRKGDLRFTGKTLEEALYVALHDPDCLMINRNHGSGTRHLIEELLQGKKPGGYAIQPKSHNAVAVAVRSGRADWGVAIHTVACLYELATIPIQYEHYDFLIPTHRMKRPGVQCFLSLLSQLDIRNSIEKMGFTMSYSLPH